MPKRSILISFLCVLLIGTSCKKFLEIPPPVDTLNKGLVFDNDASATSAVVGIYSEMMNAQPQFSNCFVTLYAGLAADELYYYAPSTRDEFVQNQLTQASHPILSTAAWASCYKYIYIANLCLEQLANSTAITPGTNKTLTAECRFIRAFCYFHLVNLFGDVPLLLTSDYTTNQRVARTAAPTVYRQIIADLKAAEENLSTAYVSSERTRPNKWAAALLLARVYLYNQNWAESEAESSAILTSSAYTLVSLQNAFLKNNAEAIWQLQPVVPAYNTYEGFNFIPASSTETPKYLITASLLAAFTAGDSRKAAWIGSRVYNGQTVYYPYKYKVYGNGAPVTEYYTVFRLAEAYLIRAEARAQQNNPNGALLDLNAIRSRAGLSNLTATDKEGLLTQIDAERRLEFFAEWGNRWYDLKRRQKADDVLGALKPSTWQPSDKLWPIPLDQLNANPSLVQNPGY